MSKEQRAWFLGTSCAPSATGPSRERPGSRCIKCVLIQLSTTPITRWKSERKLAGTQRTLTESWNEQLILPPLEKQDAFWRPMFSESSVPDKRPIPGVDLQWHLANPISPKEVEK